MSFRVKADKLSNYDISTAYLVVERDVYATGAERAEVETMTISEYTLEDGRLIFSYPGIAAAQMNDAIRATLHIKDAEGKEYVSSVLETSVAAYLDRLLSSSASDERLVTLIMDMVNYGAAAQVYFDRHADAPANEAFDSFKTYAGYATAYANGEAITGTYAYSISTYAWGVQENASVQPAELVNVTRAMMLYGDSAAAYFA